MKWLKRRFRRWLEVDKLSDTQTQHTKQLTEQTQLNKLFIPIYLRATGDLKITKKTVDWKAANHTSAKGTWLVLHNIQKNEDLHQALKGIALNPTRERSELL